MLLNFSFSSVNLLLQEVRLSQESRNVERNLFLLPNTCKISPKQDLTHEKSGLKNLVSLVQACGPWPLAEVNQRVWGEE